MSESNSKEGGEAKQSVYNLETDAEEELEIPKKKARKSSIFRRRSSLFVSGLNDTTKESDTTQPIDSLLEEIRQIKEYIEELENEKKDWKNVLQELKLKYRMLSNGPCSKTKVLDQESYAQYLTDEDKRFLEDQPEYQNVCKLLDQTIESQVIAIENINRFKETMNSVIEIRKENLKEKKIEYIKKLEDECFNFELDFGYLSDSDLT